MRTRVSILSLKPHEARYLYGGSRKCPDCGHSLIKSREIERMTGAVANERLNTSLEPTAEVVLSHIFFWCEGCAAKHILADLAKRELLMEER